jgi:hypothetical protein
VRKRFFKERSFHNYRHDYSRQNNGILPRNTDFWLNMRVLRLLSRVAFICNICWLLASFIQWLPKRLEGELVGMVALMGYVMSILVNVIVTIWVLGALVTGKLRGGKVPIWLVVVNALFFLLQLYIIIRFGNDPGNTQRPAY